MKEWLGVSEFVAVAESGSFSNAATQLQMSVAQVSRNVRDLETRLQVQLLHRTTRQIRLTQAGAMYLQQCRPLLQALTQANQQLLDLQEKPTGSLKLTAPVYYGETVIAPLLHEFLLKYPGLQVDLELTNTQLDLVKGGFDLAIRLGQLNDSSLQARRLGNRRSYLAASPGYLAQFGTPTTPEQLTQHRLLVGSVDTWRFEHKGQKLTLRPTPYIRCNSGVALTDAAIKGLGITQLPDYYLLEHIRIGALQALLPEYQPADDGIWGLYPLNQHLPQKVRLLLDFFHQQLA